MFSGVGQQMRNDAVQSVQSVQSTDSFMNTILHELKSVKLNESIAGDHLYEKQRSHTERAIVKSNDFSKQPNAYTNNTNLSGKSTLNQWMPPHHIDTSLKSNYHRSDGYSTSKESVWASTQSSPNSTQREQSKNQFKKSTSTPANLWETPNSKLSQATLMMKNDSSSTVWFTPPQMQSPAMANGQSFWDNAGGMGSASNTTATTSSILNRSAESFSPDVSLLRPQDLSPMDIWSSTPKMLPPSTNTTGYNGLKATTDTNTSIWRNPSPIGGKLESNVFTSTPYKQSTLDPMNECNKTVNNAGNNSASSACLQLFADDFVNYLNMIN